MNGHKYKRYYPTKENNLNYYKCINCGNIICQKSDGPFVVSAYSPYRSWEENISCNDLIMKSVLE